jgi:hypothetical protein
MPEHHGVPSDGWRATADVELDELVGIMSKLEPVGRHAVARYDRRRRRGGPRVRGPLQQAQAPKAASEPRVREVFERRRR